MVKKSPDEGQIKRIIAFFGLIIIMIISLVLWLISRFTPFLDWWNV